MIVLSKEDSNCLRQLNSFCSKDLNCVEIGCGNGASTVQMGQRL